MASEQYREISYIQRKGDTQDALTSDTTLVFHGKQAYRRIRSHTVPGFYTDVRCDGDPVEYERVLLNEKRIMADFDKHNASRAVPKPKPREDVGPCQECIGGEYEDKHGNWKTCPVCGGEG